jgi:uncharacterized protein YfaS (alpha-2-macroglobulin family)
LDRINITRRLVERKKEDHMNHNRRLPVSIAAIISVLVLACQCPLPTIFGPTPTPTPRPDPLPPQVIQVIPERGEEQLLTAPIQLVFDQPMDQASVEDAFVIQPAISGTFEWVTDRMVQFKPGGEGFERATKYTVTLEDDAESAEGLAMKAEILFRFTTVGYLEVTEVQPAEDATEVATDATVTVLFNRPVVPLVAIEDQSNLPRPLTFVPPVEGVGEWLNTSIYLFTPDEGFEPATTYKARVAEGLADTTGGVLAEDFAWEFTTVMPAVVGSHPGPATIYVSPEPTIYVAFNQPMDHASTEAAFELRHNETEEVIPGSFEWHDEGLVLPHRDTYEPYQWSWDPGAGPERIGEETLSFTPDDPLEFATVYQVVVSTEAEGASGANLSHEYDVTFATILYPRIVSTHPADGAERVHPSESLRVSFSSPMNPESLNDNFTISPPVSATQVYTYWWDSDTELEISFPSEPNTDYAVTIGGDVEGRYGHELGEDTTVRWQTRALDPLVYLHSPGRVGTYNAYTETQAFVTVRNVGRVNFALYRMPLEDFLRANGDDWWDYWDDYHGEPEDLIREWSLDADPPMNQRRFLGTKLNPEGPLEPGLYYLEVSADFGSIYAEALGDYVPSPSRQMLVVSRHNLSLKTTPSGAQSAATLVWPTDLQSGDVLPNLPITVMDETGDVLTEGTTNRDGVFDGGEHPPFEQWTQVFAFAGDPENPDEDFAAAITGWDEGISPWRFDLPVDYYPSRYSGYLFTDRPIYRPGQTVYFKGILRGDDDAHYSLPTGDAKVHVLISDPEGKDVSTHDLTLSDMGTLDGSFTLDEEAATGIYYVEADYLVDKETRFHTSFQVAEYRKPEFQVEVETDRPEYAQGDKINVSAEATYFFGGPVADAEVSYAVLSADFFFNYQGKGWWDFSDYDYWWYGDGASYYGERIAEGEGTTDDDGRFTFSLDADIAEEIASQRYTLEVTVTDVNYQEVSNRTEAIVHKGSYYIGLRPKRYVGTVDQEASVNVITVDWESEPAPNRELTVVFAEHNWYNVQKQAEDGRFYWEWAVEDVPVYTATVETGSDGEGAVSFTPEKGGSYKVIATGLDEKGNEVRSSTYMWISGREYVSWRRENNDRIDLVTDKREYQVGDTATILVPHPFQGPVQALVTIERGHIYEYWVQTLETNSEQLEIPITEDLIPNIFVSVVIVKGTDETSPLPSFKVGYVQLPIETTEKELTIDITPDKPPDEHYQPGDTVTYEIDVTDSAGDPVEAEVTLALIDLAVLTLADRPGQGLVDYFWRERGIGVNTATGLTLSGDRVNEEIAREVKGLGGGGGGEEFGPVRKRFPDLAYWEASLRTDSSGHATVSVELPDNLTTWRMSAWAATGETLVGQTDVDIISTKDLLVRSVAPRFFVVGDEAELAAVVHNNTNEPVTPEITFDATGLQIEETTAQHVEIPAGDKAKVTWSVTVENVEEVTLRFGARAGDLADALEITLPVYPYSTPEVVATAGQLKDDGQVLEAAALPPSYDPTQGELSVHIDPSLAAGMVDGLDYLEHFPYECTEQTVSRFLPNVVTYRAFQELGLDRPDLEASLPDLVSQGLQRLYNQQHYDGGWGWWVEDESRPYLTAYVLLGMIEADRAGFTVDEDVMEQAVGFLEDSFVRSRDLETRWKANQQAFILYVLAEAGEGDLSRSETLFQARDALDTFGKAYLAMAFGLLDPDETDRVDTLLSDITSDTILSATGAHWEEERADYYAMNTDTRSTAIVLAALARLDPDSGLAPNVVRWLMVARKDGYWETTQETAWAIIGLTDWMVVTGELEGNYDWHVIVNGELLGEGSVNSGNVDQTTKLQIEVAQLLAEEANRVAIERWAPEDEDQGAGRLYYAMYLRYFKPVEEVTALNRGIIVSRQYTSVDCDPEEERCPAIDEIQVGEAIRVKLTIIAPSDLHYVVVEDPFPAGTEGVDQSLKTTSVAEEDPELTRTDRYDPWGGWGWWWFNHTDLRDEKAVLFASYLPRGTYEYTYLIRASLPGEFRAIPTHAYEMYFPEVFGRSDGGLFTITE